MTSFDVREYRNIIKLCVSLKKTPTETIDVIKLATGKEHVNRATVYKWHGRFTRGENNYEDNDRTGRPKKVNSTMITSVRDLLDVDRRASVRYIAECVDISKTTAHYILTDVLGMRKVSARWVPRLLSNEEMEERVNASGAFLRQYQKEGDRFMNRIVTTDETLINLYDPETKQESKVWKRSTSPPPIKARVSKSAARVMFIMFMDRSGMLLVHAVPQGQTVNAEYYSKVVRRDLVRAIRKKRPGAEIENLILHQDNAPPHRAKTTTLDIDFVGFTRLRHAPYSPDIAPMDFAVFPDLKKQLRGTRHTDRDDLIKHVHKVIRTFEKQYYANVYDDWLIRHRKVVDHRGVYFEKL